jgi:hypothetical protein
MPPLTTYIWYIVKKSTKANNSVKFGRSKNSFLYFHLHIKVVHPWKFKQNLPSGLRGVAFTKFLHSQCSRLLSKHINLLAKIAREEREKGLLSPWDETLFPR